MRWESWQPSRHSTGCLTARTVTELTCPGASREVGAQRVSAHKELSYAEMGEEKLGGAAPALIINKQCKHVLPNSVIGTSAAYLQWCFTVITADEALARDTLPLAPLHSVLLHPFVFGQDLYHLIIAITELRVIDIDPALNYTGFNPEFVLVASYWPSTDLIKLPFLLKRWSNAWARVVSANTELWPILLASWKDFSLTGALTPEQLHILHLPWDQAPL